MIISFKKQDPKSLIAALRQKLEGRELGKIVNFALSDDGSLVVTIKKLGSSELHFAYRDSPKKIEWILEKQRIALTHKAFKGEVMDKIVKLVEQNDGKVSDIA